MSASQPTEERPKTAAEMGIMQGFPPEPAVAGAGATRLARERQPTIQTAKRAVLPRLGRDGWDYVLIGRAGVTASRRFADLVSDLEGALGKLHGAKPRVQK